MPLRDAITVVRIGSKGLILPVVAAAFLSAAILGWSSGVTGALPQTEARCGSACQTRLRADQLGINVSNLSFSAVADPHVIVALQQSGATWIRINLYWGWLEQTPGKIDWSSVDQGLAALAAANISALVTLNGPVPCWAFDSGHAKHCSMPEQIMPQSAVVPWIHFVAAAVARYRNHVHYWEIWNEPDLLSSIEEKDPTQRLRDYRDKILRPGGRAVRLADPGAKIVAPAFAAIPSGNSAPGVQLQTALRLICDGGGGSYIDIISLHSYYPYSAAAKLKSAHKILNRLGLANRPFWITELGASGQSLSAEDLRRRQAEFLLEETTRVLKSRAADKVFWFALTDSPTSTGGHADDYGLISNEDYRNYVWNPRPAYVALQHWIRTGYP